MDTPERFAKLSYAKRLNVGAIVVKDDRIISIGYNGMQVVGTMTVKKLLVKTKLVV